MSIDPPADGDAPASRSFLGNVNVVMVTYIVDGVLALVTSALVARGLGPDGRGAYGLFIVSAALGQMVLGLGIGNAAVYYINKRELPLRDALATVHAVTLAAVAVTAVAVAAIAPWAGDDLLGGRISPWWLIAGVPALLYMSLLRLLLQALGRFVDLGVATIGQQALLLLLVGAAFIWGDMTPTQVVAYLVAASLAAALYALLRIGVRHIDPARTLRPGWRVLKRLAGFGVQGEAGNVLQMLNYRLDQYIVNAYVGIAAVGLYAVSASMTEAVFVLANAVALVLMPRLTAEDDDGAASMTSLVTRNMLLVGGGLSLALAAAAPALLPAVFGGRFDASVDALWLLLPGTVALTGSKVLTSYIFSRGRPAVNTAITVVSLAVTVAADFALIPRYGIEGAAAASSLAYGAHFCAALWAYHRISGEPPLAAVLPRRADAQLYADAARGILGRLTGKPLEAGG